MRVVGLDVSTNAVMDTTLRVGRRHRSWPEALKREIVAASFAPGASAQEQLDNMERSGDVLRERLTVASHKKVEMSGLTSSEMGPLGGPSAPSKVVNLRVRWGRPLAWP